MLKHIKVLVIPMRLLLSRSYSGAVQLGEHKGINGVSNVIVQSLRIPITSNEQQVISYATR